MAEFNYTRYVDDLKKAAELYNNFLDIAATYRKSAEVIEKLWKMYLSSETDATNLAGELVTVCAKLDYLEREPIVRCKDCKWRSEDDDCTNVWWVHDNGFGTFVRDDDFCSYGERRDSDG